MPRFQILDQAEVTLIVEAPDEETAFEIARVTPAEQWNVDLSFNQAALQLN